MSRSRNSQPSRHHGNVDPPPQEPSAAPPDSGSKLVQMRFQPGTVERVENLQDMTGITNRTQIVATAIELAEFIAGAIVRGGKVYVEREGGDRELITVVGLNLQTV